RREIETVFIKKKSETFKKSTSSKTSQVINPNQARNNKGLATYIRESTLPPITNSETDQDFRTLTHTWEINSSQTIILANIYGPNDLEENNTFFIDLANQINSMREDIERTQKEVYIIAAGDMNARADTVDAK